MFLLGKVEVVREVADRVQLSQSKVEYILTSYRDLVYVVLNKGATFTVGGLVELKVDNEFKDEFGNLKGVKYPEAFVVGVIAGVEGITAVAVNYVMDTYFELVREVLAKGETFNILGLVVLDGSGGTIRGFKSRVLQKYVVPDVRVRVLPNVRHSVKGSN